jgi:hypothetical protein
VDALEERGLARVVSADENRDIGQCQFDFLDPFEALDLDS